MSKIKAELQQVNFKTMVENKSVDEAFEEIHKNLVTIVDKIAPYESFVPGKYSYRKEPWLPVSLLKSIKKQKILYTKTLSRKATEADRSKYKEYRNTFTKIKRHCKCQFYVDKCTEFRSNSKALWNVINKITSNSTDKSCVVEQLKENGISYNNPKTIARIFNEHFSTVGKRFAKQIKASKISTKKYMSVIANNTRSIFFEPVTEGEINKIIRNLPNKKSSGYDQIDNVLLKELKDCLIP